MKIEYLPRIRSLSAALIGRVVIAADLGMAAAALLRNYLQAPINRTAQRHNQPPFDQFGQERAAGVGYVKIAPGLPASQLPAWQRDKDGQLTMVWIDTPGTPPMMDDILTL